jgi:transcription antitermination factor NusG
MRGLESFLPLYESWRNWTDRRKLIELPVFPGYLFCRLQYSQRLSALNTPGIRSIVGFNGQDTPVPEVELQAVRKLLGAGYPVQPWPFLKAGETVRILDGPLAGVEGTVLREKSRLRVVVSIELLQRSVAVEIDRTGVRMEKAPAVMKAPPAKAVSLPAGARC